MNKRGLGKGLGALIPTNNIAQYDPDKDNISEISINEIIPNSFQPRKHFDPEKLAELAASIKEHGILQPIIVRPSEEGYELVVGERRLRACKQLGLEKISAVIRTLSDRDMTEIALVENIQRHNLNPVEEAVAYKRLIEEFGITQDEVAKRVGKSRPFIANFLRLLNLSDKVLNLLSEGILTVGHARALLAIDHHDRQIQLALQIQEKNLSVRETEELVKKEQKITSAKSKHKASNGSSTIFLDIQERLRSKFSTKVLIKDDGKKGRIEIEYYDHNELERLIDILDGSDY
ncbi:MAG: ParB/RepB/Spo0J family partition protein [Peptococcaceae bacterium]